MAEHHATQPTHAYVLVTVDPAETPAVMERLQMIPGAVAREVLGPYDIVVELDADGPEYLTEILRTKVRPVPGVRSTVTCIWID